MTGTELELPPEKQGFFIQLRGNIYVLKDVLVCHKMKATWIQRYKSDKDAGYFDY